MILDKHHVSSAPPERITSTERMVENGCVGWSAMDDNEANKPAEYVDDLARHLRAEDLYDVETYFMQRGGSEFLYDEKLDIFRFPEDGRFAFCKEFADWVLLEERGYLDF
jgi:hypothetical protein